MNGFDSYQLRQRATAARFLLSFVFIVLIGAFFRTQILQHDRYQLRAETNRLRPIPLEPPRGPILGRTGEVIAENLPGFAIKLFAPSRDSLRAVLERFAAVVPIDSADREDIAERWATARYQPVLVLGDASFATMSRVEEHRPVLPGLIIQSEPKRMYPQGRAVAHLVGYVSEVTETDLERNRFPGAALGSIVGKAVLERQYDSVLRGRAGVRYAEVNARGRLVREDVGTASLPPTTGNPLQTTLDLDLQRDIDTQPVGVAANDRLGLFGSHGVVRAHRPRELESLRINVGRDDPRCARRATDAHGSELSATENATMAPQIGRAHV